VKLLLSLTNIPQNPIVSCGNDRLLKFLNIKGEQLMIESQLNRFLEKFEKIQYDSVTSVLRVMCVGFAEYAWRFEQDGKWRQFHEED
jgi:hypothetical protein